MHTYIFTHASTSVHLGAYTCVYVAVLGGSMRLTPTSKKRRLHNLLGLAVEDADEDGRDTVLENPNTQVGGTGYIKLLSWLILFVHFDHIGMAKWLVCSPLMQ